MLKSKKFIILMLVMTLLVCLCTQVRATTDDPLSIPSLDTNTTTTDTNTDVLANTADVNTTATNETTNTQVIQPTNTTGSSYTNSDSLPQTGVTEDITVMFFIVVCVIVAIYAYKKIREYKA